MSNSTLSQNKMGTAPLGKLILSMSLPAMFSMLVQALYNIVDSMYVAHISEDALTAVSLAFPMQTLIIAVGVGTGIGINSLIARRLGAHMYDEANNAADHGIFLGILSGIVFALMGFFLSKPFIGAFTDNSEIANMGTSYLSIVLVFSIFVFVEINCEKILQATGNMIWPMIFQLTGAITNIILDPIFIFGYFGVPAMGIKGAAIATIIGQFAAMLVSLYVILFKKHDVHIDVKSFKPNLAILSEIYKVGFPSMIMQSISSVLVVCLNAILISFSSTAVAVLGVYFKLQSFVFMPLFGINQGIMPIMGYNFGAKNKSRLTGTIKIGIITALVIMSAGTLLFSFIPNMLLLPFDPTEDMMSMGSDALRIISLSFPVAAVSIMFSTMFQAIGRGVNSMLVSLLRQLFLILPIAFFLSKSIGVVGVWWAFPIAEIISFIFALYLFILTYNRRIKFLDSDIMQ